MPAYFLDLARNGIVTDDIKEWAHIIRHLGNDGAHPYDKGQLNNVRKDDVGNVLNFMEAYLNYVYIMPYEVAEKRKKP